MKRGYIEVEGAYCASLLLCAFLLTLILDMGVGPLTIVFGAMNLSMNSRFPAATWLLVE